MENTMPNNSEEKNPRLSLSILLLIPLKMKICTLFSELFPKSNFSGYQNYYTTPICHCQLPSFLPCKKQYFLCIITILKRFLFMVSRTYKHISGILYASCGLFKNWYLSFIQILTASLKKREAPQREPPAQIRTYENSITRLKAQLATTPATIPPSVWHAMATPVR